MADFGDFVRTEDEELDLEEVVEPWNKYDLKESSRVFYPICVGEVLDERYLIEHKIGSGGFATVWMAHDLQDKRDMKLFKHLVTRLATFQLRGNKCHHQVLVFPLMGPCLCRGLLRKLAMGTRMSAAQQLLAALENLHKAGIVHRDLNERNCMWGMVPLHNLKRSAKYELLGQLVRPIEVPESIRTEEFYLGDFGLAMNLGDPGGILSGIVRCLGPLPKPWKGRYTHPGGLDSWYDQSKTPDPNHDLASTIAYFRPEVDEIEREQVRSIMSRVFTYCPEERLTATQLLQDSSFRAIMNKYGC
ncbi:hypothetical protein P175DRAFT_0516734 [Aspergillus ochraceoroseus IBT 24754]|uniref:Protein kinase domain-containing protein n=1 Tax=Aspergillus ochraceoroseus IBT 24754 TaxID=1392256 RepID=A0A2T5LY04_9EURO|nr:uncharacterized protein P175DRAFT_0516734 [Aspergillus ochraceoroseus IBT 24754]PTU21167.1 hypothetical protein P175DRAFT_0516734 [Aspergillus ochraceoroseus IBT 24754]